nr:uncharacterized protein LOC123770606 [Procambarus clarkii]
MAASSPVIQPEDVNRLLYGLAVTKAGRDALASVFMWSYRGTFPVVTYLTQDLGYTNAQYRRVFDDYQRDKLEVSSDAATFDITLLYKLLQLVCGLAEMNDPTWTTPGPQGPSLEHLIHSLKQHRNTLAHDNVRMSEQDLTSTLTELSDLLAKMLAEAGVRCGTNSEDVDHVIRDVTEYIGGLLAKWVEDPDAIRHLGTVDLVFYVQCRDSHLNTFDDLLRQLLPQTLRDSGADFQLFKEIILSLNILVLIDGYDQVNDHSLRLVKELLHLPGKDVRLVITTRPGWDQQLSQLVPHTRPRCNILVLGITPERRVEFAERTMKVLVEEESQRSVITGRFTQRLEQMSQFLGEYLNTPLTLTLLALLCVEAPEEFNNLTTNTQVYEKIHDFITNKLVSRLTDKHVTEPKRKCDKFLLFLEEISLRGIQRKEYDLWPETEAEIRVKCDTLGLPQEEVLSNYFTRTSYRRGLRVVWVFGYVHARYQEYCASRGLVALLLRAEQDRGDPASHRVSGKRSIIIDLLVDVVRKERGSLGDHLRGSEFDIRDVQHELRQLSRWQNILLSTTGVLCARGVEHRFITYIIDLSEMVTNSTDELLKHVAESRGSEHVIQAVCEKLRTELLWTIWSVDSCVVLPLVLKKVTPKNIYLVINDTPQLKQCLSTLSVLAKMKVTIYLGLGDSLYSKDGNIDKSKQCLERLTAPDSECTLEGFDGGLPEAAIPLLPPTLEILHLRLTLQQLPALIRHLSHLPHLQGLGIDLDAMGYVETGHPGRHGLRGPGHPGHSAVPGKEAQPDHQAGPH